MHVSRVQLGRFALFLIYFWFGLLKLLGTSPASPLVLSLLERTMPFMSPELFLTLFALFEMLIGILFLFPQAFRFVLWLFIVHMAMTIMPLFMLPAVTWQSFLVPTLEGQYIIKNIALISIVAFLATKRS